MHRATPFVWLPGQRVDHQAGFATLRGAPLRREDEGVNRWVLARGRFDAAAAGTDLAITVDGRYRLWLNGEPIGRGPVRGAPHFQRFDTYRLPTRRGANLLAVLIHVPGVDLAWYETAKGGWQPVFGDGGLFAELTIGDRAAPIAWRMFETSAWRRDTPRAGWGQDFIEDFDARALDPRWIEPGFADDGWAEARAMISIGDADQIARGFGRVEPFPCIIRSELADAAEATLAPARLLWIRAVVPAPELPLETRLYAEALGGDAGALVQNAAALLDDSDDVAIVRTTAAHDTAIMLAFAPYHAGRPFIELDARGGEIVEVAVAEAVPGEYGRGIAGDGLRAEGHLGVAHVFRYTARPGRQRFETFNWTAVRALQLVVRNAAEGLAIRRVGSLATHYPADAEGAFACSDALLTRLWEIGRHTVLQCMHDGWVDCPGREARQWIGDGAVQFDVAALAFGASVFPLHRQFLDQAAEGQRADGLVRMFAPGDIAADALVIPDFSLLWILSAERYYRHSGDLDAIDRLLPAIERALAWFERQRDVHGLLADVPHWHFIEWAHLDRRGEAAAINALYVGALDATAVLAEASGRPRLAGRCRTLRDVAAAALEARHWDAARGVYVDSVAADGTQGRRVSQHGNALMLLFDIAARERHASILAAITDPTRLKLTAAPPIVPTGEPFDEECDIVRANSFFGHYVYAGIARAGGFDRILRAIGAGYGPMLATGTTTLWESFTPDASLCHGFSATPVYQLSRHCLGIAPVTCRYERFTVAPEPGDLAWARGKVPTPLGPISVEWQCRDGALEVAVAHPSACRAEAAAPPGWRVVKAECTEIAARFRFERD